MTGKRFIAPIGTDTITYKDKAKDLDYVNIIKEKRDRKIKGSTCANISKQKRYLK